MPFKITVHLHNNESYYDFVFFDALIWVNET